MYPMTTKRSFFDLLALADVERVHSAVIGWLLSSDCDALTERERSQVLNELFGLPQDRAIYKTSEMRLEWENIDILWLTETHDGQKECWILENKIKSSQHRNQLDKYVSIIKDKDSEYKGYTQHYCFLTVVGEPAKSSKVLYQNRTYAELVSILNPYFTESKVESDWTIAREYFETIRRMTEVTKTFLEKPANFSHVFTDGNKSMREKLNSPKWADLSEFEKYISEKGMETLMQKYYLYKVMEEVLGKPKDALIKRWHVGETHGNADMAIHFEAYPERVFTDSTKKKWYWVYGSEDEIPYQFDISFQNGTFKFAISDRYWSNECWENNRHVPRSQNAVKKFVELWEGIFKELKTQDMTLNHPKKNGRARLSLSYSIEKLESSREGLWFCWDKEVFIEIVKKEFEKAIGLRRQAIDLYKRGHQQAIDFWKQENEQNIKRKEKAEKEKQEVQNNSKQETHY